MGTYEQNKYTLLRRDGTTTNVTDGDLADQIHPMSLVKMKQIIDQENGNTIHIRRALHKIKEAEKKIYQRAALADFDLCIIF
ncbi:hypothetical protein Hanom_Chr03g00205261 [Helianthus anomalus]